MVLTFEFDDADEACEMEYAFRDAWGHKFDTKWDGDVEVYVEVDDPSDESTPVLFFDKDYTEKRDGSLMESRTRSGRMLKESNMESAKEALADYLKVPVSAISESDEYDYYRPDHEFEVETDEGTRVYCVYDDEKSALTSAVADLEEKLREDEGLMVGAIDEYGIETILNFFEADEEQKDYIERCYDEFDRTEFARMVPNMFIDGDWVPFDFREFAKTNIDDFGVAWHLADYDGKENVLGNGMLAYREE